MRIGKLTIKNFKGIVELVIDADGKNVKAFGKNGAGKTTIADAIAWLFFNKDSQFQAKFEIKPIWTPLQFVLRDTEYCFEQLGLPIHNLETEVEALLLGGNGQQLTLKKVYTEKWTTKRGSNKKTLTGHTTEYYIDEVPKTEGEYKAMVAKIADEEEFKLMTSPLYFSSILPWQKRRDLVLKICGDIADEDVIENCKDMEGFIGIEDLGEIIGNRSMADHKLVVADKMKKIDKEKKDIPARIDQEKNALPKIKGLDRDKLEKKKKKLMDQIAVLSRKKESAGTSAEIDEKKRRLIKVQTEMMEMEKEFQMELNTILSDKKKELSTAEEKLKEISDESISTKRKAEEAQDDAKRISNRLEILRNEFKEIESKPVDQVCPLCKQDMPEDRIEGTKALQKKRLGEINQEGVSLKKQHDELIEESGRLNYAASKILGTCVAAEEQIASLKKEITEMEARSCHDLSDFKQLSTIEKMILDSIAAMESGQEATDTSAIDSQIEQAQKELDETTATIASFKTFKDGVERMRVLEEREEELAGEYEKLEREKHLINLFDIAKVETLEEKINSKFKLARFKMFKQNIGDGELVPCCEVLHDGVPFNSGLNQGNQILVGLDIISTLQEYYEKEFPVTVDRMESITHDIEMDCQTIFLVASKEDVQLRIEV